MDATKQKQILGCMSDVLNQNGFRSQLIEQGEGTPLMLRAETQRLGKVAKEATIEACFIPIALPDDNNGLLQFFVTLFTMCPSRTSTRPKRPAGTATIFLPWAASDFLNLPGRSISNTIRLWT